MITVNDNLVELKSLGYEFNQFYFPILVCSLPPSLSLSLSTISAS